MQWWMQHFTLEGTSTQLCCQSSEKLHETSNNLGPSTPPGSITDMHKKNLVQPLFQMIKSLTWELSMIVWQSHPEGTSIGSDNCDFLKVSDFNGSL